MSINKVILVGNLGKDPETRSFPSGGQVTNASLATNEKWKDRQGEMRDGVFVKEEDLPEGEER